MNEKVALLFGDNEYTQEIVKNISSEYGEIHILTLDNSKENNFDLSDNWDDLSQKYDMSLCNAFCLLDDIAENIFLTISLRDSFKDLTIISLSHDRESTRKLHLAGATKVLPSIETTANVVAEMLEKPIVTKVMHKILYEQSDLKIAQVQIDDDSLFLKENNQKLYTDIEWCKEHGIIVISVVHEDMSSEFIYSSKAAHHVVQSGDTFVVVGYDKDIQAFEKIIGQKSEK